MSVLVSLGTAFCPRQSIVITFIPLLVPRAVFRLIMAIDIFFLIYFLCHFLVKDPSEGKQLGCFHFEFVCCHGQLLLCDQVLAYLGKHIQEKAEESKAADATDFEAPAKGMRLMKKKGGPNEEEESSWMFKGKGAGKKGGKGKRAKNIGEKPIEKKLKHTLDIMSAFHFLRVL